MKNVFANFRDDFMQLQTNLTFIFWKIYIIIIHRPKHEEKNLPQSIVELYWSFKKNLPEITRKIIQHHVFTRELLLYIFSTLQFPCQCFMAHFKVRNLDILEWVQSTVAHVKFKAGFLCSFIWFASNPKPKCWLLTNDPANKYKIL